MRYNLVPILLTLIVLYDIQTFVSGNLSAGSSLVRHNHNNNDDPIDPVPYPDQEECDDIIARKLHGEGSSEGAWAVVKVTPLSNPKPENFDWNINFCSPFSYAPEVCREMLIKIKEYEDDHSLSLSLFAYNNRTTSTAHVCTNTKVVDKYYAVYQGAPSYMEEFFDDNHNKIDDPIPQYILTTQGGAFAKVGKRDDNTWMIFQACETSAAFVLLKTDIKASQIKTYEPEYMAAMNALNIDTVCMVDVPVVDADGLSFRQCLYNLDDIIGAANLGKAYN